MKSFSEKAIVIGGSAGSFKPLCSILSGLNSDFNLPVFLALHRLKNVEKGFLEILSSFSILPISEPFDKYEYNDGEVLLAPSNYHMYVNSNKTISLSTEELINFSRPSIDITINSVAKAYQNNAIAILLSGANKDGVLGMKSILDAGGTTIVQDLDEAEITTMPGTAYENYAIDYCLKTDEIIQFLNKL
ncbi:MAG: chemotaxis protein CheB [Bacteroidota bacterium]